jgi:spore coat polysaccharide biosynthesis protein SpsF
MKIIAIIQARMGSTRLPGKVMADICGKPLLQYVVDRVEQSNVNEIVVACPEADWDKIKIDHREYRVPVVVEFLPGDENDVAGRFAKVLERHPCEAFMRVCADSPLIMPELIEDVVKQGIRNRTYMITMSPMGCAEYMPTDDFLLTVPEMGPHNREHVTTYWRAQTGGIPMPGMPKLTIDTTEDLERVRGVISRMTKPHIEYGWRECLLLA